MSGDGRLVIAPSWVGDTVMALPTLRALSASDRRLSILAKPHLHPLLQEAFPASDLIPLDRDVNRTVGLIRGARFDEAVLLPNSFHSAWLAWKAGIPRRWGYRGQLRAPLLRPGVPKPDRRGSHQVEDYRDLLQAVGATLPEDWTPRLELTQGTASLGTERLERAGFTQRRGPWIGLFPGAEFGPSKRWPWKSFVELSRRLRSEHKEARIVVLAGPKEVWLAVRIHEESGHIHPVVGPDLDLAGLVAVLSHLDLLVTNDSGPMHLAAAVGTPSVALFGPTDPARTAPVGASHAVLYQDRWCSPCFRRRCPLIHHRCLRGISVDQTAEACRRLLEAGSQDGRSRRKT